MRRDEFECFDSDLIQTILDTTAFGTLCINDTPTPYGIPLSFCYTSGEFIFHSAASGRKFALLKSEPQTSFTACKPYAYIASSFLGGKMVPTQFFFSVMACGRFEVVSDNARKKGLLEALVRKYEPENPHFELSGHFGGKERGVFVGILKPDTLTAKAKFGQNLSSKDFESIICDLQKRNSPFDKETIDLMRHFKF